MDIGSLKQETIQAWIPFDDDTEILIAYISRDDLRKLQKQATSLRFVKHQKTMETDPKEADRLLGRMAVKDWRPLPGKPGFTMDKEPFPYTPENCDFLMERFNEFANFVNAMAVEFANFMEEEKADTEKNSSITSGQG